VKDLAELNREVEDLYRRVRRMEGELQRGSLPRVAARSTEGSYIWHDVELCKLLVWNGRFWDAWTKDV
jgi:hypothetical protein